MKHISATLRVFLLVGAITAILVGVGHMVGGTSGMVVALALSAVMSLGSYWFSDRIVVAMTGAQPVEPGDLPRIEAMVGRLAQRAGIPTPRLYVVPDPSPNAFATGRSPKHGVVALNEGILRLLPSDELEGVIAHEIAHIKHRDTLTGAVVATLSGAVSSIGNLFFFQSLFGGGDDEGSPLGGLVAVLVAPVAATMVQMGVSRIREYEADRTAAELTGRPLSLRNALARLHAGVEDIPGSVSPSAAHLCIVNPFTGFGGLVTLFSTHPPVEKRMARLEQMAVTSGGTWGMAR